MQLGSNVMRKGMVVGLASVGHHSWMFTKDLLCEARPLNLFYTYYWVVGRPIDEAYNIIFDYAVKNSFAYVFLKEEDTIAPPEAWTRLFNRLKYNPDVFAVTGIYPRKEGSDPTPFIYRGNGDGSYIDWKWNEFFEVTGIPFGCTMLRVEGLLEMAKHADEVFIPNYPDANGSWVKAYCRMQVPLVNADGKKLDLMSQDIYFSELARKAGLKLYADASVNCQHVDLAAGKVYTVPQDWHKPKEPEKHQGKVAANIGCGSDQSKVHGLTPIRIDFREEVNPDLRLDISDMSGIKSESYDYIKCSHTLEHFRDDKSKQIFGELYRVLKPGGELHLIVPDIQGALEMINEGNESDFLYWHLYGRHDADWNIHHTGFTATKMGKWLTELGMKGYILRYKANNDYGAGAELWVRAFKAPLPAWFDEWVKLDKQMWSYDKFFAEDL